MNEIASRDKTNVANPCTIVIVRIITGSGTETLDQESTQAPTNINSSSQQVNSSVVSTATAVKPLSGNTVSCVIELKTVWFNFAAPPRTPITRKIDYTRLDWNLLSTASPAINAWMNPSNRFAIQIVHMFRCMYRRSTAVVACLMAEALDMQAIHMPLKVRLRSISSLTFRITLRIIRLFEVISIERTI
jgi:hypothetical protein